MENYQVYKTRLGQQADIVNDLRNGRSGWGQRIPHPPIIEQRDRWLA